MGVFFWRKGGEGGSHPNLLLPPPPPPPKRAPERAAPPRPTALPTLPHRETFTSPTFHPHPPDVPFPQRRRHLLRRGRRRRQRFRTSVPPPSPPVPVHRRSWLRPGIQGPRHPHGECLAGRWDLQVHHGPGCPSHWHLLGVRQDRERSGRRGGGRWR